MFGWIRKFLFVNKPSHSEFDEHESQKQGKKEHESQKQGKWEQIEALFRENPNSSELMEAIRMFVKDYPEPMRTLAKDYPEPMRMLAKDFEIRRLREDKGGAASSPVSSS